MKRRDLYHEDCVEARHALALASDLCREKHDYDAPGGRVSVCWDCQVEAAKSLGTLED